MGYGDHRLAPGLHLSSLHRAGTAIFSESDCDYITRLFKHCTDSIQDKGCILGQPDILHAVLLAPAPALFMYFPPSGPLVYQPRRPSSSGSHLIRHQPQGCYTCCIFGLECSSYPLTPIHHDFLMETPATWSQEPFLHSTHHSCHVTVTNDLTDVCLSPLLAP